MENIQIKIVLKPNSPEAKAFREFMEEKKQFKQAVMSGTLNSYAKENNIKFDRPLSINH